MMQQHIALERFAKPMTSPAPSNLNAADTSSIHTCAGRNAPSAVLTALKRWPHAERVIAIGHLPEPWIPQLISLALAEGQMGPLQDLFLRRMSWCHNDPRIQNTTTQIARINFLAESIDQRAMPVSDALPLLQAEVGAAAASLGAWIKLYGLDRGDAGEHLPKGRIDSTQWVLLNLCSTLVYCGDYASAGAVMAMRMEPWAEHSHDELRAACGREALVLVQLARKQYEGAVEALLGAPCWAQVATVGRRLSIALHDAGQPSLQRRVDEHLAAGQAQDPAALEQWHDTLEHLGTCSIMPGGMLGAIEAGAGIALPHTLTSASAEALAARRSLTQRTAEYLRLLAVGDVDAAVAALLDPEFEPVPLDVASGLITMHLMPSLGFHHYSVITPDQQAAVQRLTAGVWEAVGHDQRRVSRSCRAQLLLSQLAWLQLNRGSFRAALAVSRPPAPLLQTRHRSGLGTWLSNVFLCKGGLAAVDFGGGGGDRDAAIGVWQWRAVARSAPRQPRLPEACGLLEHACALLGSNIDLSRQSCGGPADEWCRQELSLLAAAPLPGGRPAYSLQPRGAALLRALLDTPSYLGLRACMDLRSHKLSLQHCDDSLASFERLYALNDLNAAAVTFATSGRPERVAALDLSCLDLMDCLRGHDRVGSARFCSDASLTRAALLAIYDHPGPAAQLVQRTGKRLRAHAPGSGRALDVVRCVQEAVMLAGCGSSSSSGCVSGSGVDGSEPHAGAAAASLPAAAVQGRDGGGDGRWAAHTALISEGPQAAAATAAAGKLLAMMPCKAAAAWQRLDDEMIACREVLGLMLLQPLPELALQPHRQGRPNATAQELVCRLLGVDAQNAGLLARWQPAHYEALHRMLQGWERERPEAREAALRRLLQVLQAVMLPGGFENLLTLVGGVLQGAPEWAYAPQLAGAWLGWGLERDCSAVCGDRGVRCWEAFAAAHLRRFEALAMEEGEELPRVLSEREEEVLRVVVRMAPAEVWFGASAMAAASTLAPAMAAAAPQAAAPVAAGSRLTGGTASHVQSASEQLTLLLQLLAGSWEVQPSGVAAMAGREWCVGLVREARVAQGKGRHGAGSGSGLARAMANAIAAVACVSGMQRLADVVLGEVEKPEEPGAAL